MKKLFILFIGLTQSLIAQDIVFKENFDLPSGGDSVSSYGLIPTTNIWKDTSFLAHSGTQSGMGVTEQLNTVFLQTDAFSTLGKKNVVLEFDHIAKLHFFRHGKVEISVDSGSTWVQTDTAGYYGNSPNFKTLNYFNEISYPVQSMSPYWGGPTITPPGSTPTNSWWAHETFDISDVAGIVQPNGDTGYANVMVRFSIVHNNGPQFATGWLIDDIKVTGSKCELVKPQISFNTIPQYFPNGPVYLQNQRVDVMVSDNEGLDSVAVTYRENGGPWMRMLMTPLSFLNCGNGPHSVQFKYDFLNIAVGDTIDYFITAYDCSCPNSAQEPIGSGNYHTFFREPALPTKCGVTYPGSFPNVIYNFPWIEDFEDPNYWVAGTGSGHTGITHRGSFPTVNPPVGLNWKVAPNPVTSGFAWSVRDQPTVTTNTGPNQNHTPNGSTFIYTEGSQGSNNSSTQFITPCIDLSNVACPQVEFYYHMYGNDINRLVLLVDTGIHAYAWTPAIWKHLGGDQTSSSDPWKRVVVSLEEFKGKIITLNFLGRRGNGEKSDIAIDDVKIFDAGSSVDFVLSELTNPIESNCTYSNNESVTFHVKQIGCTPVYKLPLAYAITDSSSGLTTTVWDTLFNPLGGEIDSVFSFSTPADLSNYGLFGLKVFSNYSGDIDKVSDTIAPITIEHNGYVSFPYFSDFDDSPWVPGDGTTNSPGVMDSSHFIALAGANAQYRWVVSKNNTPEYNTGPARDYSGNGNYLVTVGGSGYNAATYISKCIDIPATGNPVITFMSYLHGSNIQSLLVQAKEDGGNWQSLPGGAITPWTSPQGPAFDPWTFNERTLSNYKGKKIRIRILGIGYQNSFANIAIDNLSIHNQITNDVGIIDMVQPNHFQETPVSNGNIQLIVGNFGMALQFATPVTVDLIPKCGGNTITHTGSTSLTILSNSTGLLNISTNSFPNGDYTLKAYTTLTGDSINYNDTLYRDVTVRNPINVSNGYFQDFEGCAKGTNDGYTSKQGYRLFKIGQPDNPNLDSAYSGNNAIYLYRNAGGNIAGNERMLLPRFTGMDSIVDAKLKFKHRYQLGAGNMAFFVEVLHPTTLTWTRIGEYGSQSTCDSVYNGTFYGPAWQNSSSGWQDVCLSLDMFDNYSGEMLIRFMTQEDQWGKMEWVIDDIEIEVPNGYDLEPERLVVNTLPTVNATSFGAEVDIRNAGIYDLYNFDFYYQVDNGPVQMQSINCQPKVTGYGKYTLNFTVNGGLSAGLHNLCVWTANPNGNADENMLNDTLCVSVNVLSEKPLPYCVDFENGQEYKSDSQYGWNSDAIWEYGTPNQTVISSAYSGNKTWMTGLSSDYTGDLNTSLITAPFTITSGKCTEISFYHNYKTQNLQDGGNVEISYDNGTTWNVLGAFGDSSWYNTSYVFGLGVNIPGFSGNSNGWIQSTYRWLPTTTGPAIIRFRFATNPLLNDEGWAIDDVCIKEYNSACNLGIEEDVALRGISVYPNPSQDQTVINRSMANEVLQIKVLQANGSEVMSSTFEAGEFTKSINTTEFANGMYIIQIHSNNAVKSIKLIVQH